MVLSLSSMVLAVARLAVLALQQLPMRTAACARGARRQPMRWGNTRFRQHPRAHRDDALSETWSERQAGAGRKWRGSYSPSVGVDVRVDQRVGHCVCWRWFAACVFLGGKARLEGGMDGREEDAKSPGRMVDGEGGRGWIEVVEILVGLILVSGRRTLRSSDVCCGGRRFFSLSRGSAPSPSHD